MQLPIKHYKKGAAPMDCFIVVIEKDGRVRVVERIEAKRSKDKWAVVSRPIKNLVFDLPRFIQGVHNLDSNWLEPMGMDYLEANFNASNPVETVFSWEQARTIGALLDSVPDGIIALTDISLKTPAGTYLVTENGAPWGKWDMKKTITTTIFLLTILWQVEKTGTLQAESEAFPTRAAARKRLKEILDRELNKGMFANRERKDLCDGELNDNICPDSANVWADGLTLTLDIEEQTLDVAPGVKPDIRYRKGRTATDCRRYYDYWLTLTKSVGHEETMWHISSPDGRYVGEAATLEKARSLVFSHLLKQPLK